ncbi:hypothetical protein GF354_03655 [Candidatus Peregrinibacteria bacterium]|nr:hypothetical protein [Candidatus Peregrinibacteria bacterium]
MKKHLKIITIIVLSLGILGGIAYVQVENKNLFKGQIFNDPEVVSDEQEKDSTAPADLTGEISVKPVSSAEEDIMVSVTIKNLGPGDLRSGDRFKYSIQINGVEAFVNTDSFSQMAAGDNFTFTYPIPRSIYQYEDMGVITLNIDTENTVKEENEDNNKYEVEYSY